MNARIGVSTGDVAAARRAEEWSARLGVLIVDDDAVIRETLARFVEEAGYTVLTAHDGIVALKVIRSSGRPLVVLLDVMMPGMNGIDVLNRIAADERLAQRHAFIVMTANLVALAPALMRRLKELAVPVIAKPFDLDVMLELIERAGERVGAAAPSSFSVGRP